MNAPTIIIIIIAVIAVLILLVGWFLSGFITKIRRQSLDEARAWQAERYDLSWYDAAEKRSYKINSFDGYELHVQLIVNPAKTEKYVIISHGYTDNRYGALKYARIYLDLGYSAIIYDLRGHGENEPSRCTYTARERKDLRDLIKDTRKRYDDIEVLGIHGESLGGSVTAAVLNYQPEIDFAVTDCAFSELRKVLEDGYRAYRIPAFMLNLADFFMKLRFKVSFKDMRPIDSLEGNRKPLLVIHGEADNLILPYHAEALVQATDGYKDMRLFPGARHAESVLSDPDRYKECLEEFLDIALKPEEAQ